jgi:hypothetical protein
MDFDHVHVPPNCRPRATIQLHLHRVVIRTAGEFVVLDGGAVAPIWNEEDVGERTARGWIEARGLEAFAIRQCVEVALLQEVTAERADIGDVEHGFEAEFALDGEAVVIDGGNFAD